MHVALNSMSLLVCCDNVNSLLLELTAVELKCACSTALNSRLKQARCGFVGGLPFSLSSPEHTVCCPPEQLERSISHSCQDQHVLVHLPEDDTSDCDLQETIYQTHIDLPGSERTTTNHSHHTTQPHCIYLTSTQMICHSAMSCCLLSLHILSLTQNAHITSQQTVWCDPQLLPRSVSRSACRESAQLCAHKLRDNVHSHLDQANC